MDVLTIRRVHLTSTCALRKVGVTFTPGTGRSLCWGGASDGVATIGVQICGLGPHRFA